MNTFRHRPNTVALAGWLFADLLLGMALFFLVANSSGSHRPPTPPPPPTDTLAPTRTPAPPTVTPAPQLPTPTPFISLNPEPFKANLRITPESLLASATSTIGQRERARTRAALQELLQTKCQTTNAGIVLIFGHAPDSRQGDRLAAAISAILQEDVFKTLCGERAILREFHWIDSAAANRGLIDIEVYFLNR